MQQQTPHLTGSSAGGHGVFITIWFFIATKSNIPQQCTLCLPLIEGATVFQRANGEKLKVCSIKAAHARGWVHRVGYHSSWLSVTWWSFTFLTSKPSILLTSGLNEVSTKPALWKDLQMDSCYVYQTFTALCWSHRAVVLKVRAMASWGP